MCAFSGKRVQPLKLLSHLPSSGCERDIKRWVSERKTIEKPPHRTVFGGEDDLVERGVYTGFNKEFWSQSQPFVYSRGGLSLGYGKDFSERVKCLMYGGWGVGGGKVGINK